MTDTTFKTKPQEIQLLLENIRFLQIALENLTMAYINDPTPARRYTMQRAYRNIRSELKKLQTELNLDQPYKED